MKRFLEVVTFSGRSFLDFGDIQPMRRPSSDRQLELPLGSSEDVYQEFFSDPANLREVIGESIFRDERGNQREFDEIDRRGRRSKRSIRENPNVLYEIQRRLPTGGEVAQLDDAYALRQLFGEVPEQFGEETTDAYGNRRGIGIPNTNDLTQEPRQEVYFGEREGQLTNEMSPRARTAATSRSLRPSSLYEDVNVLNILNNDPEFDENAETFNALGRRLSTELGPLETIFDRRIMLDEDNDYENLRGLLNQDNRGNIEVVGMSPAEFAGDVQSLLDETGSDPDYIMGYLRDNQELPEESQLPREIDWEDDINEEIDDAIVRRTGASTENRLRSNFPEQEMLDSGVTATNRRMSTEDFQQKYGDLQPSSYPRDVNKRLAGVGGGRYLPADTFEDQYNKMSSMSMTNIVPEDFEGTISETFYSDQGQPFKVKIKRESSDQVLGGSDNINENIMKMFEGRPYAGMMDIEFSVNDEYGDAGVPKELRNEIKNFVNDNALSGIPGGTIVRNAPYDAQRASAYQRSGFGGPTIGGQFAYIDPESGDTVPIQPFPRSSAKSSNAGRMYDAMTPQGAALRGAANLIKENVKGSAVGALGTLMDPDMREAIETGDGNKVVGTIARDIATGALAEGALKGASNELAKRAPVTAAKVLPIAASAGRALATGGAIAPLLELGGSSRQTDAQRKYEQEMLEKKFKAAEAARARGGRWKIGPLTLPELGVSESGGFFFR